MMVNAAMMGPGKNENMLLIGYCVCSRVVNSWSACGQKKFPSTIIINSNETRVERQPREQQQQRRYDKEDDEKFIEEQGQLA